MNRRAKFDAASFILGGEIRNRTNTQTKKQTVTDKSTLWLWARVDNKNEDQFEAGSVSFSTELARTRAYDQQPLYGYTQVSRWLVQK